MAFMQGAGLCEPCTPHEGDPYRCIIAWPLAAAAYIEILIDLERAPTTLRTCLAERFRLRGQNRVPRPPARIRP